MLDKDVQNHLGRQLKMLFDGVRVGRGERALDRDKSGGTVGLQKPKQSPPPPQA